VIPLGGAFKAQTIPKRYLFVINLQKFIYSGITCGDPVGGSLQSPNNP
jgi:hypothetical protein